METKSFERIERDISAQLRHREQLRFLAETDGLTGLHNRRRFERDLSEQIGRAHRYGEQATLLIVDIDGFKQINDAHGHKTGDRALKAIAATLRQRFRATDAISRIGGDEFAIVIPYAEANHANAIAESLKRLVSECSVESPSTPKPKPLSISIGSAAINAETENEEAVFAEADRAMYQEKKSKARPTQV